MMHRLDTLRPTRVEMLTSGPTQREQQIVGAVGISMFDAPDAASADALGQQDPARA